MNNKEKTIRVELGFGLSKWMTLDEYLNIDYREELGKGIFEQTEDPFYGSVIREGKNKAVESDEEDEEEDYTLIDLPFDPEE